MVGMRSLPSPEHEHAVAEIKPPLAVHDLHRRNDLDLPHDVVAEFPSKRIEIEHAAPSKRTVEVLMADESCADERGIAEDVVWVRVGVDHEANWLFCHRADRRKQAAALAYAAAAVDDGNRVTADDKTPFATAPSFARVIGATAPT